MPKLSQRLLEKKKMDRFLDDFWTVVASLETKEEVDSFFYDLLTHTERQMLAKRLQVAIMLIEGHNYQTINEEVEVATSTITRVNNWLKTGADGLIKAIKNLIDLEKGEKESSTKSGGGRYMAGNLLMPAIDAGIDFAARKLKERQTGKLKRRRRKR